MRYCKDWLQLFTPAVNALEGNIVVNIYRPAIYLTRTPLLGGNMERKHVHVYTKVLNRKNKGGKKTTALGQ